ncbi:unnamed protein product [Discula destructiva]
MQFNIILFSSFLGLAAAASSNVTDLASQLPSCSQSCLANSTSAAGCDSTDYSCHCEHEAAITTDSTTCLMSSCSVMDISTTQKIVTEICEAMSGNSTADSTSTPTSSSTSSSSSPNNTMGSSSGNRMQLTGLGWAAIVGVVGFMGM